MANRKYKDRNTRKLIKLGQNSIALTIPVALLKQLKWRRAQKVSIKKIHGGIQVKDWKR